MKALKTLRILDRHGAAPALIALLLIVTIYVHTVAHRKAQALSRVTAGLDVKTVRRMHVVEYMHTHPSLLLLFVGVMAGSLLWLEMRRAPRWSVWCATGFLSLPCFAYIYGCAKLAAFQI